MSGLRLIPVFVFVIIIVVVVLLFIFIFFYIHMYLGTYHTYHRGVYGSGQRR